MFPSTISRNECNTVIGIWFWYPISDRELVSRIFVHLYSERLLGEPVTVLVWRSLEGIDEMSVYCHRFPNIPHKCKVTCHTGYCIPYSRLFCMQRVLWKQVTGKRDAAGNNLNRSTSVTAELYKRSAPRS